MIILRIIVMVKAVYLLYIGILLFGISYNMACSGSVNNCREKLYRVRDAVINVFRLCLSFKRYCLILELIFPLLIIVNQYDNN